MCFNFYFQTLQSHRNSLKIAKIFAKKCERRHIKMEIKINLNGKKRKELAQSVGEILNALPIYQRGKNHNYEIGEVILDKENTLIFGKNVDVGKVKEVVKILENNGFPTEKLLDKLVIQMPLDGFDDVAFDNLQKLVSAKSELIKKALGVEELPIEQTKEGIFFPWFNFETPSEDVTAYSQFIAALCDMAKKQKRVTATEKSVENEKYAFRCFLLRLGFIGDEYSNTRRVLLRNLDGNGSCKNEKSPSTQITQTPQNAPLSNNFEESAELIAKHLIRGFIQCLEMVL
jgi:hypothetical protein